MNPSTLDRARELIDATESVCAGDRWAAERLAECSHRLEEPLRIAIAGSLKAGKSTSVSYTHLTLPTNREV